MSASSKTTHRLLLRCPLWIKTRHLLAFTRCSVLSQYQTAVFFGMLGVTFFGLFLTPVFYLLLRSLTGMRPLKQHGESPAIAAHALGMHA